MKVQNISFKGYREEISLNSNSEKMRNELNNISPCLSLIGNHCLPKGKDLFVKLRSGYNSDYLTAYYIDRNERKSVIIANESERSIDGNGLIFIRKVFEGLKKYNPTDFDNILDTFSKQTENKLSE